MTNKVNYDLIFKSQIEEIKNNKQKPTLLLHSCCAPCSSLCLERVTPYFNVTVFYYNPNITIEQEYLKRLNEQVEFCKKAYQNAVSVISANYEPNKFLQAVKGLRSEEHTSELQSR